MRLSPRTAHERAHRLQDQKAAEKFRWPWEKIANKSLNLDTDDDDVVMLNANEASLRNSVIATGDT